LAGETSASAHSHVAALNEAYSARSVGDSRLDGTVDELPLDGPEDAFHLNASEGASRLNGAEGAFQAGSEVGSGFHGGRKSGCRSDESGSDGSHSRAARSRSSLHSSRAA